MRNLLLLMLSLLLSFNVNAQEIEETKETFKLLQECLDSLQGEQGHLVYGEEWRECDRSDEHLQLIKKRISEEKTDWKLMLASSSGAHWSWEKS